MQSYYSITDEAKRYLSKRCSKMRHLIKEHPVIQREITSDTFLALCYSIIGQQISTKAAATISDRFDKLFQGRNPCFSPQALLRKRKSSLQKCGLSYRKVAYLKGIASAAVSGEIDFENLASLMDDEVISNLVKLNGVGVWTAEMLLIFSLQRPDVLSFGDLAIRNALMQLHGLDTLSKNDFTHYKDLYSPHGSTAALYLWASQG